MIRHPLAMVSLLITSPLKSAIASSCSAKLVSDGSQTCASTVISMCGINSFSYSLDLVFLDGKYLVTPFNTNRITRGSFGFSGCRILLSVSSHLGPTLITWEAH